MLAIWRHECERNIDVAIFSRIAAGATVEQPKLTNSLVCRESSIVGVDGGRFTTPPPSRLEARGRLGS
jgi:hypothetical protein